MGFPTPDIWAIFSFQLPLFLSICDINASVHCWLVVHPVYACIGLNALPLHSAVMITHHDGSLQHGKLASFEYSEPSQARSWSDLFVLVVLPPGFKPRTFIFAFSRSTICAFTPMAHSYLLLRVITK